MGSTEDEALLSVWVWSAGLGLLRRSSSFLMGVNPWRDRNVRITLITPAGKSQEAARVGVDGVAAAGTIRQQRQRTLVAREGEL